MKSKTTSVHAKLLNLKDLSPGNEDLDMVKTKFTANISEASHILGDIHSFTGTSVFS